MYVCGILVQVTNWRSERDCRLEESSKMELEYNRNVDCIILAEDRVHLQVFVAVVMNRRVPYTNRNVLSSRINIPSSRSTLRSYSFLITLGNLVYNRICSIILNVTEVLPSRTGCLSFEKRCPITH
jgi:hypothetical protein